MSDDSISFRDRIEQKAGQWREIYNNDPRWLALRRTVNKWTEQPRVIGFLLCLTFVSLFAQDIMYLWLPKSVDPFIIFLVVLALLVFTLEHFLLLLCKNEYFLSWLWFVDLVALLSLYVQVLLFFPSTSQILITQSARALAVQVTRSLRLGRQGARLTRTIRMVRSFFFSKVFTFYQTKIKRNPAAKLQTNVEYLAPSELGTLLASFFSQKVVILVLIIVLIAPFLIYDPPLEQNATYILGTLDILASPGHDPESFVVLRDRYIAAYPNLMYLFVNNTAWLAKDVSGYRGTELNTVSIGQSYAVFDIRLMVRERAEFNIAFTVFVVTVLVIISIYVSKDADRCIVQPMTAVSEIVNIVGEAVDDCSAKVNEAGPLAPSLSDPRYEEMMTKQRAQQQADHGFIMARLNMMASLVSVFFEGSMTTRVEAEEGTTTTVGVVVGDAGSMIGGVSVVAGKTKQQLLDEQAEREAAEKLRRARFQQQQADASLRLGLSDEKEEESILLSSSSSLSSSQLSDVDRNRILLQHKERDRSFTKVVDENAASTLTQRHQSSKSDRHLQPPADHPYHALQAEEEDRSTTSTTTTTASTTAPQQLAQRIPALSPTPSLPDTTPISRLTSSSSSSSSPATEPTSDDENT